jgi:NDP-mannose synthase
VRAFILAGGKGTRLRPYTVSFPKPLVPIGDRPILEIVIHQLARQGFDTVTISTGHLAELIGAYFGDGARWGIHMDYLREDAPLSTAGPLAQLEEFDEPLLVMNGDVLTTMDYAMLVEEHERVGAEATVAVTQRTVPVDFGVVHFDDDNLLSEWIEKPRLPYWVSTGVYVTSPKARALVGAGEPLSMPDLLMRVRASGGSVYCSRSDAYWLDIGRIDDYQQAQDEFESRRAEFLGESA